MFDKKGGKKKHIENYQMDPRNPGLAKDFVIEDVVSSICM